MGKKPVVLEEKGQDLSQSKAKKLERETKYAHVAGNEEDKAFMIKTLEKAEKMDRIKEKFDPILESVNTYIKEKKSENPQLLQLQDRLKDFVDDSDPRNVSLFKDYSNKLDVDSLEKMENSSSFEYFE